MSTKNLERVPLEGGHSNWYKNRRHEDTRRSRRKEKFYTEHGDHDAEVAPKRKVQNIWRDEIHDDRLAAVGRWCKAQVGRKWDDVYSELRDKFDIRTLAGHHIVVAHLIPSFCQDPLLIAREKADPVVNRRWDFLYVEDGIVKCLKRNHTRKKHEPTLDERYKKFIGKRILARSGAKLCWAEEHKYKVPAGDAFGKHVRTELFLKAWLTPEENQTFMELSAESKKYDEIKAGCAVCRSNKRWCPDHWVRLGGHVPSVGSLPRIA